MMNEGFFHRSHLYDIMRGCFMILGCFVLQVNFNDPTPKLTLLILGCFVLQVNYIDTTPKLTLSLPQF